MSIDYDVAVVGAGPIGLCTAILIARQAGIPAARIAVFDRRLPEPFDSSKELPVDLPNINNIRYRLYVMGVGR